MRLFGLTCIELAWNRFLCLWCDYVGCIRT